MNERNYEIRSLRRLDQVLSLANGFIAAIPNILIAAVVFGLFYYVARQIRVLVRRTNETHSRACSAGLVFGRLSQGAIVLVGTLVGLTIIFPSFSASSLINLLGSGRQHGL